MNSWYTMVWGNTSYWLAAECAINPWFWTHTVPLKQPVPRSKWMHWLSHGLKMWVIATGMQSKPLLTIYCITLVNKLTFNFSEPRSPLQEDSYAVPQDLLMVWIRLRRWACIPFAIQLGQLYAMFMALNLFSVTLARLMVVLDGSGLCIVRLFPMDTMLAYKTLFVCRITF